jgi:glycosyltransferase involved in cell wall biosynthesis
MKPDITVIIPYHNEKKTIAFTLERVGAQTLPPKFAMFVNSSSTDDTFDVVEKWIEENQTRFPEIKFLNIFDNTNNPASSKNAGVKRATTEWVAFMDCGQKFESHWLESQYNFAVKGNFDVVSGVVYLVGENWIDKCCVAQTYGYKNPRPCLPTSLIRKAVFEKTGLLLEGRRAGYDAAWPLRLKRVGIDRGINLDITIRYIGTNYSSNISHLFKKTILYAKPTVAIQDYWIPYVYMVFPFILLASFLIYPPIALFLLLTYIFARSYIFPTMKSKNIKLLAEHPLIFIFGLPLIGLIMDIGRVIGICQGIKFYYFDKPAAKVCL